MKLLVLIFLTFIAATVAGPISVSDNNVGDIVTVGINANLELSNKIEQNIISVIFALLNQQAIAVIPRNLNEQASAEKPQITITPEMIERVKKLLTKNLIV